MISESFNILHNLTNREWNPVEPYIKILRNLFLTFLETGWGCPIEMQISLIKKASVTQNGFYCSMRVWQRGKVKSAFGPRGPIRPVLNACFRGMKRLGVFLLPPGWDASPSQGYPPALNSPVPICTPGWREAL